MLNLVVGGKVRNMKTNVVVTVTGINGMAVETINDVTGEIYTYTKGTMNRWWNNVVVAVAATRATRTARVATVNGDFAWLQAAYNEIGIAVDNWAGVTYKVNTNGTMALRTRRGNFAEIKLQSKKLIVRVLQAENGLGCLYGTAVTTKAIPETFGWAFKTELTLGNANDVIAVLCALTGSANIKGF